MILRKEFHDMKVIFGRGYKISETDQYIAQLTASYEAQLAEAKTQLANMQTENEQLRNECAALRRRETGISEVLISAAERAQSIEKEYQQKAALSELQYEKIRKEWAEKLSACRNGITMLQAAAEEATEKLKHEIKAFSEWNDSSLLSLNQIPSATVEINESNTRLANDSKQETELIDLEKEIIKGASVDLMDACKALGLYDDEN